MKKTDNRTNEENAQYCKGCAWLHIGVKVAHNHCDYTADDEFQARANGQIVSYATASRNCADGGSCRYYWDEEIDSNPTKTGIYNKAPKSDKCPNMPEQ